MSNNLTLLLESLSECNCSKQKLSLFEMFIKELKDAPKLEKPNKGCSYEKLVANTVKKSPIAGSIRSADCRSTGIDVNIKINGQYHNVEVKESARAQMGGGSFSYDGQNTFAPTKDQEDEEITDLIKQTLLDNKSDIDEMLYFISNQKPVEVQNKIKGFPLVSTHTAWEKTKTKGKLVNLQITANIDWIKSFYYNKGVNYIQIGGAGLFYLNKNPANLPIPELSGEVNLEIRTAANGARTRKYGKSKASYLMVGGFLRVQARLKTNSTSPYSLDNPEKIIEMLSHMKSAPGTR